MKKLFALFTAVLIPGLALAGGNHPMAGCGLAYALFSSKDNSKPMQILASTTNNLWGTQTFGITSGTSGCTADGAVKFVKASEVYADVNFRELTRDMAAGGGEYLTAFSRLVGVNEAKQAEFGRFVQDRYNALLPSSNTSSVEMLNNLQRELSSRSDLLG